MSSDLLRLTGFESLSRNFVNFKLCCRKRKRGDEMKNESTKRKPEVAAAADVVEETTDDRDEEVDLSKVDFSQYKGGSKKGGNGKEFNPWKDYDRKGKSSKAKQRFKPAPGKSVSYKK